MSAALLAKKNVVAKRKNFLGFGGGSKVMSSSRLSKDAYNQGYLGKKDFNLWLIRKEKSDNLHSSAVRELRRQNDLGNSDRLAHEQQKNQLALLKQSKRETPKPAAPPKGEKLADLGEEYKGRNIKRTAKGFEVLGETWNTKNQAREYVDLYNITGGKVRTKTNSKRKRNSDMTPTYKIAMAAGRDAGNRSMKEGKRTAWNLKDRNAAAATFEKIMGKQANSKRKRNSDYSQVSAGNPKKRNGSDSSVRSPTRTSSDVRSPTSTKTATKADTRGNITVTGGAGAGATTSVTIERKNAGSRSHRKTKKAAHKRMGLSGKQPKKNPPSGIEKVQAQINTLVDEINKNGNTRSKAERLRVLKEKRDALEGLENLENPSKKRNFAESYIKGKESTAEIVQGKAKAQIYQIGSKSTATVIAGNGNREEHSFSGDGSFKAAMSWARLRLHEVANPGGKFKLYPAGATRRKNPAEPAARMYEKFHGIPSTEVREYQEERHHHNWLTGLGPLISIKIRNVQGNRDAELPFPDPMDASAGDVVMLCATEDGSQLMCVGGDQELDTKALKNGFGMVDADFKRDNVVLGTITEITYRTKKSFEKNGEEEIDFYHALGSEGSRGVYPVLLYHPRDESFEIAGGRYYIGKAEASLGRVSPGLIG
jgi:hypothetical protein